MLTALIFLFWIPAGCTFVDQDDQGVALVRRGDGSLEVLRTSVREGTYDCGPHAVPAPRRLSWPHRALSEGTHTIQALQE